MRYKRMSSRYAGTCSKCQRRFGPGTTIDYNKNGSRGRKASHVDCENPTGGPSAPLDDYHSAAAWNEREARGLGHSSSSYGDYGSKGWNDRPTMEITTSSGTFYPRAGGRCEDAPCCGCCTF
jgi:hypothetical protein